MTPRRDDQPSQGTAPIRVEIHGKGSACAAGDGGLDATDQTKEVAAGMKGRRARYPELVAD